MSQTKLIILLSAILIGLQQFGVLGNASPGDQPRIIIIGAGAAGIAAASKLFENGFRNVTVLEAEDRIGGRVWTIPFGEYVVDLGGQWISNEEGNLCYELAWPLGLLHKPDSENSVEGLFTSSGDKVSDTTLQEMVKFLLDIVGKIPQPELANAKSFGDIVEKMFDDHFMNNSDIVANKNMLLYTMERWQMTQGAADNWFDLAVSQLTEHDSGCDEINWKERGYSTIFDILMKRYPDPEKELPVLNNTILNAEVSLINITQDTGIVISTINGNSYIADHVILTSSLGVLKEMYKTMFSPPLPDWKIDVIKGLGFGTIGKIYLLYDKPFWTAKNNKEPTTYVFAWNEKDKAAIIKGNDQKEWLLGMSNAATVEYKPNLLSLWMAGESARKMEQLSDEKIVEHCMENLRRFLGKHFNVTEPTKMIHSKWYSNPHFRGSYSFRSPKSDEMDVWAANLANPLPDRNNPKLLFAGEATNPHHFATVHGAIQSGWNAAETILKLYPKYAANGS